MTRSSELDRLFHQIADASTDAARLPLINQALALADEADDVDSAYRLRLALVNSAHTADDKPTALAAFSGLLAQHEAEPERFPLTVGEPYYLDLAWMFKWMLSDLNASAAITRSQIEQTLAEMRRLYQREGLGTSAVAGCERYFAQAMGDLDRLSELADVVRRTPSDRYSDCPVCVETGLIDVELDLGNLDEAHRLMQETLTAGRTCQAEPQATLASVALDLLLDGRTDLTANYVNRVLDKRWKMVSSRVGAIADILQVCAITENVDFGLELFERWLGDLNVVLHSDTKRLTFLASSAVLCDRANQRGLGQRPVRDTLGVLAAQDIAHGELTVANLVPQLWTAAERIANALDAAHGGTYRRDHLAKTRSHTTVSIPLSLGREQAEPLGVALPRQPQTAAEWVGWAKVRSMLPDWTGTLDACDRALATGNLSPDLRFDALAHRLRAHAELVQIEANVTSISDLDPATQTELETEFASFIAAMVDTGKPARAAIFSALGLARYDRIFLPDPDQLATLLDQFADAAPADRAVLESQLAIALAAAERPEEAAEFALLSAEHTQADPDPEIRQHGQLFTAHLLTGLQHPEARTWLERVVAEATDDPSIRATGLMLLAQTQGAAGELAAAAETVRLAGQLYVAIDAAPWAANAARIQAAILEDLGDLDASIRATRRILELTDSVEDFDQLPARVDLGRRLVAAGQADQALSVLAAVDSALDGEKVGSDVAYNCAYWLGQAQVLAGNPQEAADVWRAALDLATRDERDAGHVPAFARALGNLFADHGLWDAALETYETMRSLAHASEDPFLRIGLDERVGLITCMKGDPAGLESLARARATADECEAGWAGADITDSMARGLQALGRIDEAVAAALDASDRFSAAGDEPAGHRAFTLAAAVLANADRIDEAIALLDPVADQDPHWADFLTQLRENRG